MPIYNNTLMCYDIESSSADPHTTQVLSLSAVMIDPRKLEIIPNSEFNSFVKPDDASKVEAGALKVNKLNLDDLMKAPSIENVWRDFVSYTQKYAKTKKAWDLVIPCGANIIGFDNIIMNRLKERFGTKTLFHPIHFIDTMNIFYLWFENNPEVEKLNMDYLRGYFGMSEESKASAHTSAGDVNDCAQLIIKELKLRRNLQEKYNIKFKGAFAKS